MKGHKRIITDITVRFRDVDAMGHVNNAVFFTYFEEGRAAFLDEVLGIVDPGDYPFILAHLNCDFNRPVKLGDRLVLEIWVDDIGKKSFTFKYRVINGDNEGLEYAKGESIMVLFDYTENKTIPIPHDFLEKITPYSEQD